MHACVMIPARYASSRFPGKPLVALLGKPMVLWVAELSARAVGSEHVYVATDDQRIADVVEGAGFAALITGSDAATGTDRLAEAAHMVDYDIYVNVQGDEPLVQPEDIRRCIEVKRENPELVVNGFTWLARDEDPTNVNIPKVVTTEDGRMVYMSRVPVPGYKEKKNAPVNYIKQVCIYGFTRGELAAYQRFGRKSALEQSEDIEILRFLELGYEVRMFETAPGSHAVDAPEDVKAVEEMLKVAEDG